MGFFRNLIDRESLAVDVIKKQIDTFYEQQRYFPNDDQHAHLAQVFLSRKSAQGEDISSQYAQNFAFAATFIFACIPPPDCARLLGIALLAEERPDIMRDFPYYKNEFLRGMEPLQKMQDEGRLEQKYKKQNPNMWKNAYLDGVCVFTDL